MTSLWEQHGIEHRVVQILRDVPSHDHHFGRPFLTAYQLAIEFDNRHHDITEQLQLEVGGAGTGVHVSLAKYLARQLSGKMKNNREFAVEGAFLSNRFGLELKYQNGDKTVTSSVTGTDESLSMFRLRQAV
jgi:hypothetical protein